MHSYSKENINLAVAAVESGVPLHEASCDFGVPKTSISNRINGSLPANEAYYLERKLL